MDRYVLNSPEYGVVLAKQAGFQYDYRASASICRVTDGVLRGGVLYDHFNHESIAGHVAGYDDHWLSRDMLWVMFDYPFNQLGCKRMFGYVPETNTHALEFDRKIGFKYVTRIDGVYPGNVACIVLRLEASECRHLSIKPRTIQRNVH